MNHKRTTLHYRIVRLDNNTFNFVILSLIRERLGMSNLENCATIITFKLETPT